MKIIDEKVTILNGYTMEGAEKCLYIEPFDCKSLE
jgi:hypothetical protein